MSPTLLRTKNLRVVVYPKDHGPPHIHVIGPDAEARFQLEDMECIFSRGFSKGALKRIGQFLRDKEELLKEAWDEFQG